MNTEERFAQQDGRIDGLTMGREFVKWLDEAGRLAGPLMLIEMDGEESGYILRMSLVRALEGRKPADPHRFALVYGVNFCAYFDTAVMQLTMPTDRGTWLEWFTRADIQRLLTAPALSEQRLRDAWEKYQAGRYTAGKAIQDATHPDKRLPFDDDDGGAA